MLEVKNITKSFRKDFWSKKFYALQDLSFDIKEGVITGFLGANGAGKTTLMKIVLGFISSDDNEGKVLFSDEKVVLAKARDQIGFLPERPYFYPHLTGAEFCHFMGKLQGLGSHDIRARSLKWAKKFSIEHALERQIRSYSKGMLQRLGFIVTLIHNPRLIILDEPLSGLDPIGRSELKSVMVELASEGKTVFFSSHIVSDVEEISRDVVFIESGRLIYSGAINKLLSDHTEESVEVVFSTIDPDYNSETFQKSSLRKKIIISKNQSLEAISLADAGKIEIHRFQERTPSLEEIVYRLKP